MKKVLLASTALVAMAGVASAQSILQGADSRAGTITIQGDAEMGLVGGNNDIDFGGGAATVDVDDDTPPQFFNDLDIRFILRGETDGGLQFGAQVDLDEAGNLGRELDNQGTEVFISGAFGRLIMGDTDGAVDFVVRDMNGGQPGSINDDETSHAAYYGNHGDGLFGGDNQVLRYDNTFGQIRVAFSIEQYAPAATGVVPDPKSTVGAADFDGMSWAIGGAYEFEFATGSVDVALGYKHYDNPGFVTAGGGFAGLPFGPGFTNGGVPVSAVYDSAQLDAGTTATDGIGDGSQITVGATLELDIGLIAGLTYSSWEFDNLRNNITHTGLGVSYAFDAFSFGVNYGIWEHDNVSLTGYGLSADYNLGGGARLVFGYGADSSDDFDFNADGVADDYSASRYSFGLSLAF